MESKELLFNIVKKLESGEIVFDGDWVCNGKNMLRLVIPNEDKKPVLAVVVGVGFCSEIHKYDGIAFERKYSKDWNNKFKKNFYQNVVE